jgi:hypothetical protein
MSNLPFTVFDFFAYLVPGAVLLAAFDYAFNDQHFANLIVGQPSASVLIVLIIIAYMLGQINDSFARWFLNNELVGVVLWQPSRTLFEERPGFKWLNPLLGNYYVMLPPDVRKAVDVRTPDIGAVDKNANANDREITRANSRFMRALGVLMLDKDAATRLGVLETQYSFCRNLAIALFAFGFWLLVATHWHPAYPIDWLVVGVVAGGTFMAGRFLRFYRQHALELFVMFARQPISDAAQR